MLKPITAFQVIGAPVGKGRPKFARRGNFVQAYTPTKTKDYEALVQEAATKAMRGKSPCAGAVQINFGIFIEPPKSWSKKKRADALDGKIYPTVKPDWDNIVKGIQDACNEVVFVDDKQIINSAMTKRYDENARVEVRVYEVTND
ncbi:phage protein [Formosimonas limnophila]|uniref:Phage protein n=1 Tax=Formosimonas limnophila TaxID=1384487 RepID=A0A8J3FZ66_9BURK|nr:RusA family crossover junction endodeoxyribonuclease [Formosimonas limnophila]GHA66061.1 phage protein [Formosimonas limnophila]